MGTNTYSFHFRISILHHFYQWSLALHLVLSIEEQSWFLSHFHPISNLGWKSVLIKNKNISKWWGVNSRVQSLSLISLNVAFIIKFLVLIHHLKMAEPTGNIDTSLKQVSQCFFMLILLFIFVFRLKPLVQPYTS
jgi:hypothetical protein